MNSGQMTITIAALLLLSIVVIRVNSGNLVTNEVLINSKVEIAAISLANSIIEEATSKAFDEYCVNKPPELLVNLTSLAKLKKDSGEIGIADFDDMDDYNKVTIYDSISGTDYYEVYCEVGYVDDSNPENFASSRTWHKKIIASVTSKGMLDSYGKQDTIKMSSIRSYW